MNRQYTIHLPLPEDRDSEKRFARVKPATNEDKRTLKDLTKFEFVYVEADNDGNLLAKIAEAVGLIDNYLTLARSGEIDGQLDNDYRELKDALAVTYLLNHWLEHGNKTQMQIAARIFKEIKNVTAKVALNSVLPEIEKTED